MFCFLFKAHFLYIQSSVNIVKKLFFALIYSMCTLYPKLTSISVNDVDVHSNKKDKRQIFQNMQKLSYKFKNEIFFIINYSLIYDIHM